MKPNTHRAIALREAFHTVKQRHPFNIDAIVVLPDHLHCIWTLPNGDADFSTHWRLIKTYFSRHCLAHYKRKQSSSRQTKKEQAIWQRRFWEHQIRDEKDFSRHVDYIHYNPVSHQLTLRAIGRIQVFMSMLSGGIIRVIGVLVEKLE